MIVWLDWLRGMLLPLLYGLAGCLAALLAALLMSRAFTTLRSAHRSRIAARYRSSVDALLQPMPSSDAMTRLAASPRRHRTVISELILAALRPTSGAFAALADAALALGLIDVWVHRLDDRRWWRRAEAARAVGFVRHSAAVESLIGLLEDSHEEVRAAAVDALGRIGDEHAIAPLLLRLHDDSRHQRARLIEALRRFGPGVAPALLAHANRHPEHLVLAIDVLGMTGATSATDALLAWTGATDAAVRATALRALGSIGLDDRGFYYALRGLDDTEPTVRAMAARAVGRSRRGGAAPYLAAHLDDEWLVAAHSAAGLRRLGPAGATELSARADAPGQAGTLARQMLWELNRVRAAG